MLTSYLLGMIVFPLCLSFFFLYVIFVQMQILQTKQIDNTNTHGLVAAVFAGEALRYGGEASNLYRHIPLSYSSC